MRMKGLFCGILIDGFLGITKYIMDNMENAKVIVSGSLEEDTATIIKLSSWKYRNVEHSLKLYYLKIDRANIKIRRKSCVVFFYLKKEKTVLYL